MPWVKSNVPVVTVNVVQEIVPIFDKVPDVNVAVPVQVKLKPAKSIVPAVCV